VSPLNELELKISKQEEEPIKDEARGCELFAAVLGLEQVLKEEGVPVQIPHNIESRNAAFYSYWTANDEAFLSPELEVKLDQEAIKDEWIYNYYCDVPTITTEAEPFKTEKRAPNQDKLTPSGKVKIISLIRQY